jgi:Ca-activated chloride channel family protein
MWRRLRVWGWDAARRSIMGALAFGFVGSSFCSTGNATPETRRDAAAPTLPEITEGSLLCRSPLSGQYEFVPLQHTDVEIDVRGLVASATVSQRYANETDAPLEAVYVFPLPPDAAVHDLEIRIGDRVIHSVVRERAEAKRTYDTAKSRGQRAALLDQEHANIFTASIANIMPGDKIEVRIRYVQPLAWEDGRVRLVFPMVVGPRYIPGTRAVGQSGTGWSRDTDAVPDASRITPPVRNPASRPAHDIALRVRLDAGIPLADVSSPTHPVVVRDQPDGARLVQLAAETTLPNRDFVLEFRRAASREARSSLFLSADAANHESHFLLAIYPPSTQAEADRPPIEMRFLIDVSGSMEGPSIEQAREALLQGLDRLRPGDRFDVVAFDDKWFEFRPAPVEATPANLDEGRRFVRGLRSGGGTEMLPALEHVMAMPASEGLLRDILVLTDGCLGNEEQIFTALEHGLGSSRLFTVAIGSAPNHELATKMARYGRGTFTHIADTGEIRTRMGRLLDQIESPVLADLRVSIEGAGALDFYPEKLPDLFLGQPLLVYGRLPDGAGRGALRVWGTSRNQPYGENLAFDTATATFHPGITTLWARERIADRMDAWRHAPNDSTRHVIGHAIAEEAIRYGLVTRFTSLVAVEETVVNPSRDSRTAAVPTELPLGWHLDKVFGANPQGGTADAFLEALGLGLLACGLCGLVFVRFRLYSYVRGPRARS